MNSAIKAIEPRWRGAVIILILGLLMSLLYGQGWRFNLPLALRDLTGLVLFFCIMFGSALAYAIAKLNGAAPSTACKIGLIPPLCWHLKEIWVAIEIFGIGPGIYSGLQGFYPFYYGLCFAMMGIAHWSCEVFSPTNTQARWRSGAYFFLPLLMVVSVEGVGLVLLGRDLLFFEGFLAGYRGLFL